jgi:hypothetical protein
MRLLLQDTVRVEGRAAMWFEISIIAVGAVVFLVRLIARLRAR